MQANGLRRQSPAPALWMQPAGARDVTLISLKYTWKRKYFTDHDEMSTSPHLQMQRRYLTISDCGDVTK